MELRFKRYLLVGIIAATFLSLFSMTAFSKHVNVEKAKLDDRLDDYKIDIWTGQPPKRFEVVGDYLDDDANMSKPTDMMYKLRKAVMNAGGSAVINMNCRPKPLPKHRLDEGDFVDKYQYLDPAVPVFHCSGKIVKYK